MAVTKIVGGQALFEVKVELTDTVATILATDVLNSEQVLNAGSGIVTCRGQLSWLSIEIELASGTDALTDFIIQAQMYPGGDWHDVQATSGDPAETLAAAGKTAITIQLGNPWAVRFKATKGGHNTNQFIYVRGIASAEGLIDH